MRWRTGLFWTVAACFALAVLLAFAGRPAFAGGVGAGMSAPSAPATSIEAAPAAKFLQPQFDWHGHVLRPSGISVAPAPAGRAEDSPHATGAAPPQYGPLYRRPPPSFS